MRYPHRMFNEQWGECFYCERDMFVVGGERRSVLLKRLGLTENMRNLRQILRDRRSTREHLQRKSEGGTNDESNIVMACAGCNESRGHATVEDHKRAMMAKYWGAGRPPAPMSEWHAPFRAERVYVIETKPPAEGTPAMKILFPMFGIAESGMDSSHPGDRT